ncbi:hypothetical protein BJV78DRAFT_813439 [Lactifluus subvellereus]|nr:hypothetical protein BJV78DRAFT_813439 [Lactifluus subvellereus]
MTSIINSKSRSVPSEGTSTSFTPTPAFDASSLLRRFSTPFLYAGGNSATEQHGPQRAIDPAIWAHSKVHTPPVFSESPPDGVHRYNLMSRGSDYAFIEVLSRGSNDQDPLLHFGEELTGFIVLSPGGLRCMQRIDLVLQVFESDLIIPSGETKRVLLQQQVDISHFSGGQYRWPFSIPFPPSSISSASSSLATHSSLDHRASCDDNSNPKFELISTMYRPGLFTRNASVRQQICYVAPPAPSIPSCSLPVSLDHPPSPLMDTSWPHQKLPSVLVKGVMFNQRDIEVECKTSYPVSDIIPLRLTMTSETREGLDLVAVPDVIDVRLFKVMGFGEKGKVIRPISLMNRSSLHRSDLAAEARWKLDDYPMELPTSDVHPRTRWRISLNGELHRKAGIQLTPSFDGPSMINMYLVCLYPFRTADFRSASDPKKPLFMVKIPLTGQP